MYIYNQIKAVHFEITSKCQAKCPMCPRRIQGGVINPFIHIDEVSLEKFKMWFDDDFIKQLNYLTMCGNLGDPIIARDTLHIYKHIRSINPTITLEMNTNGSARNKKWWTELAKYNVKVFFGIDGLEDTHHLYRRNTNWKTILKNAKSFIDAGGIAIWDMLVFKHNEHQLEKCKQLSIDIGFSNFITKHTSRFHNNKFYVLTDEGKTDYILYPTDKSIEIMSKSKETENMPKDTIICKSKRDSQIYVGSNGNVAPCCWLSQHEWSAPHSNFRIDYMDSIGQHPNLNINSLKEIIETNYFKKIEDTWDIDPLLECTKQCGSCDKFMEQYNV